MRKRGGEEKNKLMFLDVAGLLLQHVGNGFVCIRTIQRNLRMCLSCMRVFLMCLMLPQR